jgi:hypothetical protein
MVKNRLMSWPQHPPGLPEAGLMDARWLRARPIRDEGTNPFLKLPGSDRIRTLPDGLWLNFAGTYDEPFVDIFCVEACGTLQNLLDKRYRFAPRISSLMAYCPQAWLMAPIMPRDPTPRWKATGVIRYEPRRALSFPVRDIRVMYGLNAKLYKGFLKHQVPQPHELFVPLETLAAKNSDKNPEMRALVSRTAATANYLTLA